jgi:integrase
MNTTEKKILSPVLYPLNRDMRCEWFIKYRTEDFNKGGFTYGKYKGQLNLIPDKDQRLQQANTYIEMMKRGEPMPRYQGQKTITTVTGSPATNTNVINCCKKYIERLRLTGKKESTITGYRSKIKIFEEWLTATGKQHLAIGGICTETATDFLLSLKARGLCNGTFNDYKILLATIWDAYKERIHRNPWQQIKTLPHNTQHLSSYPDELRQLIRQTLPAYDKQLWLFQQCIFYCAIRPRAELRFLQIKHLNFATGIITVPGAVSKNHNDRHVNVFYKLIAEMKTEGYHNYPPDYYIFSHNGEPGAKPVSKNYFGNRWVEYRKQFEIPTDFKMYGSKHTAGKILAKKFNAYVPKEHYDHSDMKTTESYIDGLAKNELKFLQKKHPEF